MLYYLLVSAFFYFVIWERYYKKENNLWVFNLLGLYQIAAISNIYYHAFSSKRSRRVLEALVVCYILFAIGYTINHGIMVEKSLVNVLRNLLVIGSAIWYFHQLGSELKVKYLERHPMFWINTGLFIYNTGTILVFAGMDTLGVLNRTYNILLITIQTGLNLLLYILFTIAIWVSRHSTPTTS